MAEPFASYVDVEARWRTLTESERSVADQLAADASDMIRDRWTDTDANLLSGSLSSTSLARIVANMVKRSMLSPGGEGVEQAAETVGPFSHSQKYSNPLGNLYLSADDIRFFDGAYTTSQVRMGWLA